MALKGDRVIIETDITLAFTGSGVPSGGTQDRGIMVVHTTAGSGVALGDSAGYCDVVANPSGSKVAGMLLNDVTNIDETRYHRNWHKQEQQKGERCTLLRKGRVTTSKVASGSSPTAGSTAYLTTNGELTATKSATGGLVATPPVGEFKSGKDENSYACVELNLPFPIV